MQTEPNSTNRVHRRAFLDCAAPIALIAADQTNWKQSAMFKCSNTVTLLARIYGIVDPIANVICLYFVDC